jgi:formylglycine-generating enzyme required for sulfatase activity
MGLLRWLLGRRTVQIINPVDGAEMILIPAGKFLMGTSDKQIKKFLRQFPEFPEWWIRVPDFPDCWKRERFADEQP